MRIFPRLIWLALIGCCLYTSARAEESSLGKQIESFSLRDYRGNPHELSDYADSKLVVVAFLGTECPLAKLYAPRLTALSKEYADQGVTFLGVNSNRQDSITKVAAYARIHEIPFPVLKDAGNQLADQFDALRTPEVFVLDEQRRIRYRGRIDDQYGQHLTDSGKRISYQLDKPRRRDLAVALDELLAGEEVSQSLTDAPGCIIGRVPDVKPHGEVTYTNQIARILQDRCVECHRDGEIAPFPLTSYDDVVGWGETIREVVDEGRMPPWFARADMDHFRNDPRMSDEEKQMIHTWIENGSPQGDPEDLPEPREFVEGWAIPEPDQIIHMRKQPYTVPAQGVVDYQYFTADPGWKEDKWITAAECRPDNRAVVHHIIAFIEKPGAKTGLGTNGIVGFGYAPGMPPMRLDEGTAIFVPAGSKIVFQMHYTPKGSVQKDRSYMGVVFAEPKDVKYRVSGGIAINPVFEIPPGDGNYEVQSRKRFREAVYLTGMQPHMHLRGKSFRFVAEYPDGTSEVLLDVPRYDFNWQLRYELETPKLMPKGTVMRCIAHFDNSEENLANPDHTKLVRWGDQTWEEMMIGWFTTRHVEPIDHEK
jgi:peroxiredoxin/mono/diheme cytochrome c family protein